MDWKKSLRAFAVSRHGHGGDLAASEEETRSLARKLYSEWSPKGQTLSYSAIPRFHSKPPAEDDVLRVKLREDARAAHVQRCSNQLLGNADIDIIMSLLQKHSSSVEEDGSKMVTFDDFTRIAKEAGERFQEYFQPSVFARLYQQDPLGRLSVTRFYNYVMRKVWLHQTRLGLSLYDVGGQGVLTEPDFENYILELIPTLPQLDGLESSFYSFYVCTAVRRFFFFLDPLRTGKLKIQDIMSCRFLDELLELRDEDLPKEQQEVNWFSAPSCLRVYGQYLELDTDHNGMLSKEELIRYGTGTLTQAFVDRVFDECLTYEGEMDYKSYLDFVLAMENRQEPQALQYFCRLLDIQHLGYLDMFALYYFFRDIQRMMEIHNQPPVNFADVKDEIFDMVKPADPLKITLQDLVKSGQGATVVNILIDLRGFWMYENRELLAQDVSSMEDGDAQAEEDGNAAVDD